MTKGDLVRLRPGSDYASMLLRPDAIGTVLDTDGLRCWVEYQDPAAYADGWPCREFLKVGTKLGAALAIRGEFDPTR